MYVKNLFYFFFRFEVSVKFSVPNIIVEPTLDVVQKAITDMSNAILEANNGKNNFLFSI